MAVESDGVVDQFTAGSVEQRGDLTVNQSNGQDRQSHEGECQECAGTAVAEEHRIPVADIGENGTCRYCVDKDQCQAFLQPVLFLVGGRHFSCLSFGSKHSALSNYCQCIIEQNLNINSKIFVEKHRFGQIYNNHDLS